MKPRTTLLDVLLACTIGATLALLLFYHLGA
jgi:type II secretory pathway component PulJ